MFSKNINALKNNNPDLAERIEKISLESAADIISVMQSASGDLLIAYKNSPLEDTTSPLEKAKEIWNITVKQDLAKNDIVVVFGLGLGYLFKRAYVSCISRIAVHEPNIEVLRFVLEYVDFSSEISDNRIFISDKEEEILNYLSKKYISNDKIEILFSNYYVNLFSDKLLSLSENIVLLCESKNVDVVTIMKQSMYWAINSVTNVKSMRQSRPLVFFKDKFLGKTALIIAAGPSLRNDISLIKINRDKYIVFAVNKILDYLIDNDIEPDFLVASDARFISNTIKVRPDVFSRINLIATSKTDSFIFEHDFNSKIIYYLTNDSIFEQLRQKYPEEIKGYETEGTSVSQCYYAAVEMGFNNIIFTGLDLAIKPNTPYATDIKMQIDSEGKVLISGETRDLVSVKSVKGDDVLTRHDYYIFIKQLAKTFSGDESIVKYNCSDFGAYIEGMVYKPFAEIISDFSSDLVDVNLLINDVYGKTENKWEEITKFQKTIFVKQKEDLIEIKDKILKWQDEYSDKIEQLNNHILTTQKKEFIKIKNEEIEIIKRIAANDLLASYSQAQLLEFSRLNQDDSKFIEARKYSFKLFSEDLMVGRINLLLIRIDSAVN